MADPVLNNVPPGDLNTLQSLIPTDQADIAVRDLLGPTFGKALLEKVPGISPAEIMAVAPQSDLLTSIFSVFNGGVLLFGTVILVFVGLMGLTKTANDGELFGRSWNTQFTIMRMLMGATLIMPLPNGINVIQNFVMYVALWACGIGNQGTAALANHHLKQLYTHLATDSPTVQSVREDSIAILKMHICASYINEQYRSQGANLQLDERGIEGPNGAIELAYLEQGSYLKKNTPHCGRVIIEPDTSVLQASLQGSRTGYITSSISSPLNNSMRQKILSESVRIASDIRQTKIGLAKIMASQYGALAGIGRDMVIAYRSAQIQYNADGKVVGAGSTGGFSKSTIDNFMSRFNIFVDGQNNTLQQSMDFRLRSLMDNANPNSSFFAEAKQAMTRGGWASAGSTYRIMFELSNVTTTAARKPHFRFENPERYSLSANNSMPGGMSNHLDTLYTTVDLATSTDPVKSVNNPLPKGPDSSGRTLVMEKPTITVDTIVKLSESKNFNSSFTALIGDSFSVRHFLLRKLMLDPQGDPLMQIKSLGDTLAVSAETILGIEFLARSVLGVMKGLGKAGEVASQNVILGVVSSIPAAAVSGLAETATYIFEEIWILLRAMVTMLMALSYGFSTWIPSIPYVAFLFAVIGFFFSVILTTMTLPLWAAMHLTPARGDSFIGSETQGYLLLLALFTRPILSVVGLMFSYAIAAPITKLVNVTFLPFMLGNETVAGSMSMFFLLIFGLILYFSIMKGVFTWVFVLPQALPDQVLRYISAGIGDLGEGRALSQAEASAGAGRIAEGSLDNLSRGSSEHLKGRIALQKGASDDKFRKTTAEYQNAMAGRMRLENESGPTTSLQNN